MTTKKWHIYIIECQDGSFYTGITNNIDKRMKAHAKGRGSKYVRLKGFKRLLKTKSCKNRAEACRFEYEVKQLPRDEKLTWFD